MHPVLREIKENINDQTALSKCFLAVRTIDEEELSIDDVKDVVKDDPIAATLFCLMVLYKPCPELEDVIATHARASLTYTRSVKESRFEQAEPMIAEDPELFKIYVESVTHGQRVPELEEAIEKDTDIHLTYLSRLNYDPTYFTHSENILKHHPEAAYLYAFFIKNDRFIEAEEFMVNQQAVWEKYTQVFDVTIDQ